MEAWEWVCVVCERIRSAPVDIFRGTCIPSREWAVQHGHFVKKGRWFPVETPQKAVRKKRGINREGSVTGGVHSSNRFDFTEAEEIRETEEDWQA